MTPKPTEPAAEAMEGDGNSCKLCGSAYHLRDNCDLTKYCDECAHKLVEEYESQLAAQSAQIEALKQDLRIAHEGLDERDQLRDQIEAAKEAVALLREAWPFPPWPAPEDGCCTTDEDRIAQKQWGDKFNSLDEHVNNCLSRCAAAGIKTEE